MIKAIFSFLIVFSFIRKIDCQYSFIKVNSNNKTFKEKPDIAVNPNNKNFVIVWHSDDYDIYAQRFDINGIPIGQETLINISNQVNFQNEPRAIFLNENKILVVWISLHTQYSTIQGRILDSEFSTNIPEFKLDSPFPKNGISYPTVCPLSNGKFILFFRQTDDNYYRNIYMSIYDKDIKIIKNYFQLNIMATNSYDEFRPTCLEFPNNQFIVVYPSLTSTNEFLNIYANVFSSNHEIIKKNIMINSNTKSNKFCPFVAIGPKNEMLFVYGGIDKKKAFIYLIIYESDLSNKINEETLIKEYTEKATTNLINTKKISLNKIIICWREYITDYSKNDILCRLVDFKGNLISSEFKITNEHSFEKMYFTFANIFDKQFIFTFPYRYPSDVINHIYLTMINSYQRVNSSIVHNQTNPKTIALKYGGFMIVWLCEYFDGFSHKFQFIINSQIGGMSADNDIDTVKKINTTDKNEISGVSLKNGNIFLVWDNYIDSNLFEVIYGTIIDEQGNFKKKIFKIPSSYNYNQSSSKIATDNNGLNLVVWNSLIDLKFSVSGRFFNDSGDPIIEYNNFIDTNIQQKSNLCYIGNGKFLVLYDKSNNDVSMVYAKIIQSTTGAKDFSLNHINNYDSSIKYKNSGCAGIGDNKVVIIFSSGNYKVYFRLYKIDDINTFSLKEQTLIDDKIYEKYNPTLISLQSGEFIIGWEENDSSGLGVYYKSFDVNGNKLNESTIANSFTFGDQKQISIAELTNKVVLISFSSIGDGDKNGIYYDYILNCPSNKFIDSSNNNRCSDCNPTCGSCEITADNCKSCLNGYYRLEPNRNTCLNSQIPDNYLKIPTPVDGYFLKCADMCGSCVNSINNCNKCMDSNYKKVEITEGVINCLSTSNGYYLPSGYDYYKKCPQNCSECTSDTNCTYCNENYKLAEIEIGIFNCISSFDGYYSAPGLTYFKKCPKSCSTCNSDKLCVTCIKNYSLVENNLNYKLCLDNLTGYYKPLNSSNYKQCSSTCLTCEISEINCITCEKPKELAEYSRGSSTKTCISELERYYLDTHFNYYKFCSENCLTCKNYDNCTSCQSNLYLALSLSDSISKKCIINISNYFKVNNQDYYQKCSENCLKCIDLPTKCLECNTGYIKIEQTDDCIKIGSILDGYYFSKDDNIYKRCDDSCLKCVKSKDYCTECKISDKYNNLSDNPNKCVKSCPKDYLSIPSNNTCLKCNSNCETCSFETDNCLSCFKTFYRIEISTNKYRCSTSTEGYYFNSDLKYFKKCSNSCLTCSDKEDYCLICNISEDYYPMANEKNKCILKLKSPEGYFFDEKTSLHQLCDISCKTCIKNSKKCSSCNVDKNYLLKLEDNLNTCKIKCPDGYNNIPENGICKACSKICKTCESDINNCKSCSTELYLAESVNNKNTCLNNVEGYYLDQTDSIYKKCPHGCKNCLNSNRCTVCDNNSNYLSLQLGDKNQLKCVKECPDSFVKNSNKQSCIEKLSFFNNNF